MKHLLQFKVRLSVIVMLTVLLSTCSFDLSFSKIYPLDQKQAMKSFIQKNGINPSDYVVEKFKTKDVVVLGEFNKLKHEVDFVKSIIPTLYNNGVYTLAVEFGNKQDQAKVDDLLTKDFFKREIAIEVLRNFTEYGIWGYQEYLDIFLTAWEVNQGLTPKAPRFRIVLLSDADYTPCPKSRSNKNEIMSEVIENEILNLNKKALVFISSCHSENCLAKIKSMKESVADKNYKSAKLAGLIAKKYPNKIFSIIFHSPWVVLDDQSLKVKGLVKPLDGDLDEALSMLEDNPVAFDIAGSPIEKASDKKSIYYEVNHKYTLDGVCDGYIYLKAYQNYEFVNWIPDFIDESYLPVVKKYYKKINPDLAIETVGYANDICGAAGWNLYELAKNIKGNEPIQFSNSSELYRF